MSSIEDILERDLPRLAAHPRRSPDAWETIQQRIRDAGPQAKENIIMVPNQPAPERKWLLPALAVAAVAVLVIGGIALLSRNDAVADPADIPAPSVLDPTPDTTIEPAPPASDPAPDSTSPTLAVPSTTVPLVGEVSIRAGYELNMDNAGEVSPDGVTAETGIMTFDGPISGEATMTGTRQVMRDDGAPGGTRVYVFNGTIDGLGTGQLTFSEEWFNDTNLGVAGLDFVIEITGASGDFEGVTGGADRTLMPGVPTRPNPPDEGFITFDLVIP